MLRQGNSCNPRPDEDTSSRRRSRLRLPLFGHRWSLDAWLRYKCIVTWQPNQCLLARVRVRKHSQSKLSSQVQCMCGLATILLELTFCDSYAFASPLLMFFALQCGSLNSIGVIASLVSRDAPVLLPCFCVVAANAECVSWPYTFFFLALCGHVCPSLYGEISCAQPLDCDGTPIKMSSPKCSPWFRECVHTVQRHT